jgi:cysteine desulfurase/selenocysteine lyase
MSDWSAFRALFPALGTCTYLNTAGGGAMSRQVADAAMTYYRESVLMGDIGWDRWLERSERDRADVALFVGAKPFHTAFLPNASLGFNILARSLPSGSRILAIDREFPSCTTPFIRAGHDVRFVTTPSDGRMEAAALRKALQQPADAFVLSSVQYANGFRADLAQLSAVCREAGVLFLVDATQSIGAFPIHMVRDGIDALVFSGYKWATAGYGNGVLATGERWPETDPPLIGWRSARDAYALQNDALDLLPGGIGHEMGHPPFPGIFAMAEALRQLEGQGIAAIAGRIQHLTAVLAAGLLERGFAIRSNLDERFRSGILLVDMPEASSICQALRQEQVWTSARDGGLRVSLHGYNDAEDVDRFLEKLDVVSATQTAR